MTTAIHVLPECCPEYLGNVCWNDGTDSGQAFAVRLADGTVHFIDQGTGTIVAQSDIVPCAGDVPWTYQDTRAVTRQSLTAAGNIAAGAASVTITNVGTTDGTVLGAPISPGETITINAYEDPTTREFVRTPAIAVVGSATAILRVTRQS